MDAIGGKTFGMTHPAHYLDKLEWEFERLMKAGSATDRELSYHAMNFIVTAWHMTDWTYLHLPESERSRFDCPNKFQQWLKLQSRFIAACRDVATASKHFTVTRSPDPRVETVGIHESYLRAPYQGSEIIWLIAIDGSLNTLDEFCRQVITFWQWFLEMHGLLIDLE